MNTTIQEQDGKMVAFLEGRLDTVAVPETEKALKPLHDSEGKDIIIDCTNLDYISSAGLRLFLTILKSAETKNGHVYIRGVNDNIRPVFVFTGFIHIFKFI
jgi:anti-sigma B factor antagonist